MLSYWEKESYTSFDYAVIGAGISGISTAISLKERVHGARIIVLERGLRPTGASTRNAGFACFGSVSELVEDIRTMGEEGMVNLVRQRWEGLQKLRSRLGDERLRFENHGGYELLRKKELQQLANIETVNALLEPVFEKEVFADYSDKTRGFGFSNKVKGMIYNPFEAQLHPG